MWVSIATTILLIWLTICLMRAANGKGVGNEVVFALGTAFAAAISAFISFCWILINIGRSIGP